MPMEVEVKAQQSYCQFCPAQAAYVLTFGTKWHTEDHNTMTLVLCRQCLTDLAWHLDKEVLDLDFEEYSGSRETPRCCDCEKEDPLCECIPF